MRRSRYILILLTSSLLILFLVSCNGDKDQEGRVAIERALAKAIVATSEKPVPCKASSGYCYPCEFTGAPGSGICIMSLAWLDGLGKTGSKHYPVLIHPGDQVFWIASTGETKLQVNPGKMDVYDCAGDVKISTAQIPPISTPDNANDDQQRITHAVASSDPYVVGKCFKNDVDYVDLIKIKHTLDPHIYIGQ